MRVEVLPDEAFVYPERSPGPGGLPIGTGGTVAALLSGGIDSPVAAWRLMKRGCRVVFVHFHSAPYLPDTSQRKARELVGRLTQWQYASRLFLVPVRRDPARGRAVGAAACARHDLPAPDGAHRRAARAAMRRPRPRHRRQPGAGRLADAPQPGVHRRGGGAARSCGRSSAWTSSRSPAQAEAIGTFEISIEPDADCCTLFVPAASWHTDEPRGGRGVERRLDLPALVAMGVDGAVEEAFDFPAGAGMFPRRAGRARSTGEPVAE